MASRFLAGLHPGWFVPEPLGAGPVRVVPLSRAGSLQLAYEQRALLVLLALPVAGHSAGLTASDAWVDYAYGIEPDRLQVLTSLHGGWQPVADPAWTDTPDWDAIDSHAKQLRHQD
jgi:hypothetical protein